MLFKINKVILLRSFIPKFGNTIMYVLHSLNYDKKIQYLEEVIKDFTIDEKIDLIIEMKNIGIVFTTHKINNDIISYNANIDEKSLEIIYNQIKDKMIEELQFIGQFIN